MTKNSVGDRTADITRSTAVKFVVLLGFVSLFADMTYEGARSITGPFLGSLGASGAVVGFVAGFGELLGYGLRFVSGYLSDKTQRYWLITLVGYVMNLLAVPLLALAGNWPLAAFLIILERTGKAIRNPARDTMLSHATSRVGHGWGFALHEAMDQIGAIIGPIIIAIAMRFSHSYRPAFGVTLIPALLALAVLTAARILYPRPRDLEVKTTNIEAKGMSKQFWVYIGAIALVAAGYADFPLIAYHLQRVAAVQTDWIPALYAVAMGVDAVAALIFGRLYDRIKMSSLITAVALSAFFALFAFTSSLHLAVIGVVLWGVGMGAQESILRAAIAEMVPLERRGSAYGIFNAGYGLAWFLGSALMGLIYDFSLPAMIAFSLFSQLAAVVILVVVSRGGRSNATAPEGK